MRTTNTGLNRELRRLGNLISKRRILRGQTQEQVSEAASVTVQYISKIERGSGNPSYLTLLAITKALGMKIEVREIDLD